MATAAEARRRRRAKGQEEGLTPQEQQEINRRQALQTPLGRSNPFTNKEKQIGELIKGGRTEKQARTQLTQQETAQPNEQAIRTQEEEQRRLQESGILNSTLQPSTEFLTTQQLPTEPNQLVKPIDTREGLIQAEEAVQREKEKNLFGTVGRFLDKRTQANIERISGGDPLASQKIAAYKAQQKLINRYLDIGNRALILTRAIGEAGGEIPVIGDLVQSITGDRKEVVNNVKSSLEAKNQMASDVAREVLSQNINPEDGLKALTALEKQTNEAESIIKQESILSPAVRRSGDLEDIQTDILELRQEIFKARNQITQAVVTGQFDPDRIAFRLDELGL